MNWSKKLYYLTDCKTYTLKSLAFICIQLSEFCLISFLRASSWLITTKNTGLHEADQVLRNWVGMFVWETGVIVTNQPASILNETRDGNWSWSNWKSVVSENSIFILNKAWNYLQCLPMQFAMSIPISWCHKSLKPASKQVAYIYHNTIALFVINYVSSHTINISHQMITKILNCLETSIRCKLKVNS